MTQVIILIILILINGFFAASEMAFVSLNDAKIGKEISVYGIGMKVFFILTKILPHKFFIKIMRYS